MDPAPAPPNDDIVTFTIDAGAPPPPKRSDLDGVDGGVDGGRRRDVDAGDGGGAGPHDAGDDADAGEGADANAGELPAASSSLDGGSDAGALVAGAGDGGTAIVLFPDAGKDAEPEDAGPADAGPDAAPDAGPTIKDPLVVAGGSSQFFGKNPNVQIWVVGERIRKHELGAQFGKLLTTIPQWKVFFSGTKIDPIRDLDQVLIAGPQLRDSRKVVAMMYYNLPDSRVRAAVNHVVQTSKPPGEWLKDTPVEAARAFAENGERVFAIVPSKKLLVLLPLDAKDQLGKLQGAKPLGRPGVGILASTITPANALREVPIPIPASLTWVGVSVTPTADGGADVLVEAIDASPELAAVHAAELTQAIEDRRKIEAFGVTIEAFQAISFVATGTRLKAATHLSRGQLKFVLNAVGDYLAGKQAQRDQKEKERKEKEKKAEEKKNQPDAGTAPDASSP